MACSDCFTGTLHAGTPTGTISTLHGLPTYISLPPSPSPSGPTIVIIPDAFGWKFANNRVLADSYASKTGFRVLLPDFMGGYELDPSLLELMDGILEKHESWGLHTLKKVWMGVRAAVMFLPWLYGARIGVTQPIVTTFFQKLREELGREGKIGAAGFCWGGKHVFLLARDTEAGLIDAAFTAHPSFLDLPADARAVRVPMSVAAPSDDMQISGEKLGVLQNALKDVERECEVVVYEGATHGFAVRANPKIPKENQQGLEAEDQAVKWFEKYLS